MRWLNRFAPAFMTDEGAAASARARTGIRLRKHLDGEIAPPDWPSGFVLRTMREEDAPAVHALLVETLDEPERACWVWLAKRQADPDFDPDLHFIVTDSGGRLVAVALCWKSDFIKDLAVKVSARRAGVGAALLLHVFRTFAARGAPHVDLKTDLVANADAVRLYRRHGMVEVGWDG
jgi:Acetyltransferases